MPFSLLEPCFCGSEEQDGILTVRIGLVVMSLGWLLLPLAWMLMLTIAPEHQPTAVAATSQLLQRLSTSWHSTLPFTTAPAPPAQRTTATVRRGSPYDAHCPQQPAVRYQAATSGEHECPASPFTHAHLFADNSLQQPTAHAIDRVAGAEASLCEPGARRDRQMLMPHTRTAQHDANHPSSYTGPDSSPRSLRGSKGSGTLDSPDSNAITGAPIRVVSVDDEQVNQLVVQALLGPEYEIITMSSGEELLEYLTDITELPDVVLLDVGLSGMSGYEVCKTIRGSWASAQLPVIMVTGSSGEQAVLAGFDAGASDYMMKPLKGAELKARVSSQAALKRGVGLAMEAASNFNILKSMLPPVIIEQLKKGHHAMAQYHQQVTVLFSDIKAFTNMAGVWPTRRIITMLNEVFSTFDELCEQIGVYKLDSIGDAYMVVSGHDGVEDHALRMMYMATAMIEAVQELGQRWEFEGRPLQIRVGVHTGPAHSGVLGTTRPRYTFFGDTVNVASRMESHGFPMAVHVSDATKASVERTQLVQGIITPHSMFAPCGLREIKGKGCMNTHVLKVGQWKAALSSVLGTPALLDPGDLSWRLPAVDEHNPTQDEPSPGLFAAQTSSAGKLPVLPALGNGFPAPRRMSMTSGHQSPQYAVSPKRSVTPVLQLSPRTQRSRLSRNSSPGSSFAEPRGATRPSRGVSASALNSPDKPSDWRRMESADEVMNLNRQQPKAPVRRLYSCSSGSTATSSTSPGSSSRIDKHAPELQQDVTVAAASSRSAHDNDPPFLVLNSLYEEGDTPWL